jgi:hypothetical protein
MHLGTYRLIIQEVDSYLLVANSLESAPLVGKLTNDAGNEKRPKYLFRYNELYIKQSVTIILPFTLRGGLHVFDQRLQTNMEIVQNFKVTSHKST